MPRDLPLFPLTLVLFPGATQALHIFEPRYRQLLADCLAADRRFGVVYAAGADPGLDVVPTLGSVGCVAHVQAAHRLPDGRSNIITTGERRFVIQTFLETATPYPVARVEEFEDTPVDPAEAAPLAREVRAHFRRLIQSLGILTDRETQAFDPADDAGRLSFQIASVIELDPDQRQQFLAMRSTMERLRHLRAILEPLAADAERRAAVHARARRNGKGGPALAIEQLGGDDIA